MLEFCEKCGSIMLPSKDIKNKFLVCNLCNYKKVISEKIEDSYIFNKEIEHQEKIHI